jgi:ABC-type glycerol-3-phosphate transport system permease component
MEQIKRKKVKKSASEIICLSFFFVVILLWCVSFIYMGIWAFMNSLKNYFQFYDDTLGLPKLPLLWGNYLKAFTSLRDGNATMITMAGNTIWMAFLGSFVNIASSTLVAYAVSKYRFLGRNFVYTLAIFVQVVPIIGAGSASYKLHFEWGMLNNPAIIWIGWASGFDFAFLVLYGYFSSVSNFYSEAAEIDGANELTIMLRVVMPQAMPAVLSLTLLQLIGMWNNYNISLIYMTKYPSLAYGIYIFKNLSQYNISESGGTPVYLAAVLMSMIPVLIVYAVFQKTIFNNVSVGGLKG